MQHISEYLVILFTFHPFSNTDITYWICLHDRSCKRRKILDRLLELPICIGFVRSRWIGFKDISSFLYRPYSCFLFCIQHYKVLRT